MRPPTPALRLVLREQCLLRRPSLRKLHLHRTAPLSADSAPTAPPLLLKLRNDLKTAMRAKDTNRLNVVRGILNEVTNSAKTASPIKTDMQLLSVLRKRMAAAEAARREFSDAGRADLVEKEEAQVGVLGEYAGGVETWGEERIREAVEGAVAELKGAGGKVGMGEVLKSVFRPGGVLDGKPVEKAKVSVVVKQLLG